MLTAGLRAKILAATRIDRHGFDYYRHGTLSLNAALEVKSGKVLGKTAKRHTSADFIDFLSDVVRQTAWAQEIHIVLDNLSAHKPRQWNSSSSKTRE